MEQQPLYNAINFSLGTTHVKQHHGRADVVDRLPVSFGWFNQQPCILYDSTFSNPIATVAHSNYAAVCGWEECFMNATGNPQPFYLNTSDPNDSRRRPHGRHLLAAAWPVRLARPASACFIATVTRASPTSLTD